MVQERGLRSKPLLVKSEGLQKRALQLDQLETAEWMPERPGLVDHSNIRGKCLHLRSACA